MWTDLTLILIFKNSVIKMNDTSTDTLTDSKDWLDIVLPIMGIGLLILVFIMCFNSFISLCNKCSSCNSCAMRIKRACFGDPSNQTDIGHDNPETVNDDLPPSYSAARLGRSSVEIFHVVPDDVSDISYWQRAESEISDKLPSYLEIMEEKKREAEQTAGSSGEQLTLSDEPANKFSNEESFSEAEVTSPHATMNLDQNEEEGLNEGLNPPPYETDLT